MSWDWDKLKQQQQSRGGGIGGGTPPQMDEILEKFKKIKLPGGPLVILVIVIIMVASSTFFTVKQDEEYDEETIDEKLRDHALFIAFAPVQEPRIAVAVIVEHGGHGGAVAAPIARRIMDRYLLGGKG